MNGIGNREEGKGKSFSAAWWFAGKRLLLTLPVLWLVVTVVFLLIHLVPGDPIVQMLGEGATAADVSALRHSYGFDAPLHVQYGRYMAGVAHADLGQSLRLRDSVTHLVLARYPYTVALALAPPPSAGGVMQAPPITLEKSSASIIRPPLMSSRACMILSVPGIVLGSMSTVAPNAVL